METDYLKRCFGNCLSQALTEVAKVRPSDPVEYLAHWLYHYRKNAKAQKEACVCPESSWAGLSSFLTESQQEIQLKEEQDNSLKETEMTEMVKQEDCQIQQQYEKCHKPLISVASSTKKTTFTEENAKPLEKNALKQESLPGPSNMAPGRPQ